MSTILRTARGLLSSVIVQKYGRSPVLLAFALLLACTSTDADDGAGPGDGSDGDDGDSAGTLSPRAGVWSYVDGGVQENTCQADLVGDRDLMFVLENEGGSTFTIQQSDPYDDFECTKSGSDFECPDRLQGEVPIAMTDIVLEYGVSITGELDGAEAMSGMQRADIVCTGTQCEAAGTLGYTFPCFYTFAFTASWASGG